jgi:type VI secretion system protein ImpD
MASSATESKATRLLLEIDGRLSQQVNAVLHHPLFQKLEASWRGLSYLVKSSGRFGHVKVRVLDVSWEELSRDLQLAVDFDQSQFFKKVYTEQFDQPGGEPFGLLIGDYFPFSQGLSFASDTLTLKLISGVASAAFSVFIIGISAGFFGVDHFRDLLTIRSLHKLFLQADYLGWKELRSSDDSKFLGVIISPICLREPYSKRQRGHCGFLFEEEINCQEDYLWGNGVYAYGSVVIRSFKETGLFFTMKGFERAQVQGLPNFSYNVDKDSHFFAPFPCQIIFPYHKEAELSTFGFITLTAQQYTASCSFYNSYSVYGAPNYVSAVNSSNAILSSSLQNVLSLSRFAHYIKVIGRNKIGSLLTPSECQTFFERWLARYTSKTSNDVDELFIIKYPLYESSVSVRERPNKPGAYTCTVQLKTHPSLNNSYVDYVIQLNH